MRIFGKSTPFLEQVMDLVRIMDLSEVVHYLGPKPLEQVAIAISECDVGVIPNRRSIFTEINTPTRIFEYLSQGKPVIAPQAPGILDYFGAEELVLFELGDAEDLARKMERVYRCPEEIAEVVRRGQAVYRAHKWSSERERFLKLVVELVGRRRASAKSQGSVGHSGRPRIPTPSSE